MRKLSAISSQLSVILAVLALFIVPALATLPNSVTKQHIDAATDDPRQWRAEGATWADAINALIAHLASSTITADPLGIGDGLEKTGTPPSATLRVKLNGGTILRSSAGIKVDTGTGANDIVQLNASGQLPAVSAALLTNVPGAVPTGFVGMTAGSVAPSGWLLCNGAAVSRTTFADLFAVIGETYGPGDGSTTFDLPDARSRTMVGVGDGGAGLSNRTLGATGGSENAIVVSHGHSDNFAVAAGGTHNHELTLTDFGGSSVTGNSGWSAAETSGGSTQRSVTNAGSHAHTLTGGVLSAGSSGTGANMMPFVAFNCIIKT